MITIRAARVNAGLSQSKLAEILGVTKETVSRWERGKNEIDLGAFKKLSELSGIPMEYIDHNVK